MPPKAKAAPKKKNGHVLPEKFSSGFKLTDIFKTAWTIGDPIGQGGFGLIYLAMKGDSCKVTADNADYVVKIEPRDNGPLFCETHFYINCAKEDDVNNFLKSYRLDTLAIPRYVSSGLCEYNNKNYRFLVMHRYAKDLQHILNDCNHYLPEQAVLRLTSQILYALEYIHSKGYAHGDIKGANLMLKNDYEVYLVDFGLASRFSRAGTHQSYIEKPERKHNGTIEYTSRDAHNGVLPSRRADMEILGYCMVHWLSGTLPWMNVLTKPEEVHRLKTSNMQNVKDFLKNLFANTANEISEPVKAFMDFYLNLVNKLEFSDEPNYFQLQTKIKQTLQSCGYAMDDSFNLLTPNASKGAKRKQKETVPVSSPSTPTSRKKPKSKPIECPVVNGHDKSDDDDIVEIIDSKCNRIRSQVLFTTAPSYTPVFYVLYQAKRPKTNVFTENSPLNAAKMIFKNHEQGSTKESPKSQKTPTRSRQTTNSKKEIAYDDPEIDEIVEDELNQQNGHRMSAMKSHTNGKASPAAGKPIVDDSKPNRRRANMINYYNEDTNQDNSDTDDIPARIKTPTRTTPSRAAKTLSMDRAQPSPLKTIDNKSNSKSTFATANIKEDTNYIVRKRRNVSKSTTSTQTEATCFKK